MPRCRGGVGDKRKNDAARVDQCRCPGPNAAPSDIALAIRREDRDDSHLGECFPDASWCPNLSAALALNAVRPPDNAEIRRDPIWYAFYLISLGERGRALDELEIYAAKPNSAFAPWLWNRGFDPLRDEPRFKAVLAKLALPYTPPAVTEP